MRSHSVDVKEWIGVGIGVGILLAGCVYGLIQLDKDYLYEDSSREETTEIVQEWVTIDVDDDNDPRTPTRPTKVQQTVVRPVSRGGSFIRSGMNPSPRNSPSPVAAPRSSPNPSPASRRLLVEDQRRLVPEPLWHPLCDVRHSFPETAAKVCCANAVKDRRALHRLAQQAAHT